MPDVIVLLLAMAGCAHAARLLLRFWRSRSETATASRSGRVE